MVFVFETELNYFYNLFMKHFILIFGFWSLITCAQNKKTGGDDALKFTLGIEVMMDSLEILAQKRVAVVGNQTSIIPSKNNLHLVDALLGKGIEVVKIFAPEHGFRGEADAGAVVVDGKDSRTGLPIISLYGPQKKPSKKNLDDVDVVIFDIQDVGVRFYTYISTLHYVMEACAAQNKLLIVLDRPNPNGHIVDGPVLEKDYESFVGMHPVPVLHGMTIGEYALMINGENWLGAGVKTKLKVFRMLGYHKNMPYSLPVKPSPNLPNDLSVNLYASLCFFEGTQVSVGRGTDMPFQVYGSPYIMHARYNFTPVPNAGASDPLHNGKVCFGEDLRKQKKVDKLDLQWLVRAYSKTKGLNKRNFFNGFFNKLAGNSTLRFQIENYMNEKDIRASWQAGLEAYESMRKAYLLY